MCGGTKGPSAADLVAQEDASRRKAQAEADKLRATQDLEKQRAGDELLAERVALANADQARRTRNRTLLAGLEAEDGALPLEDPRSVSTKKRKLATLLARG